MKTIIVLAGLFGSSLSLAANLEGIYGCSGNEVETKSAFTCKLTIKRTGETYFSAASCSDGNSYSGTGIFDSKHKYLSTAFINPKNKKETGISINYFSADGSIKSVWTYLNKTTTSETYCKKLKG